MTTIMTTTMFTHHKPHPMNAAARLLLLLVLVSYMTRTTNAQSNVTMNSGLPPVFFLNVPNGATLTCSPSGNEYTFRSSVGRTPISANTTTNANGTTAVDEILWGPCGGGDGGDDEEDGEDGDDDDDCIVIVPLACTTCITANQQPCPSPVQQGSTACTITNSRNEGEAVNISEDFDGGFDPLCSNFMAQLYVQSFFSFSSSNMTANNNQNKMTLIVFLTFYFAASMFRKLLELYISIFKSPINSSCNVEQGECYQFTSNPYGHPTLFNGCCGGTGDNAFIPCETKAPLRHGYCTDAHRLQPAMPTLAPTPRSWPTGGPQLPPQTSSAASSSATTTTTGIIIFRGTTAMTTAIMGLL